MASQALKNDNVSPKDTVRVYSICFFDRGVVVPQVTLLEASSDEEAIRTAQATARFTVRELWDRHRLVKVIPAAR